MNQKDLKAALDMRVTLGMIAPMDTADAAAKVDLVKVIADVDAAYDSLVVTEWDQKSPIAGKDAEFLKREWRKAHIWDGVSPIKYAVTPTGAIFMCGRGQDIDYELSIRRDETKKLVAIEAACNGK